MKSHFVCYVTGGIRSGKGLFAIRTIEDFALRNCRIVTNYDLWVDNFLPSNLRNMSITRIPDRPTVEDLELIGEGYTSDDPLHYDESKFGLIVLDELGTWLNARSWNQKGRQGVIDWLLHSGKRRWSLMLTIQDIDMLDKQAKDATASQFVAYCRKMGDYPIPLVTPLTRLMGFPVTLPDFRLATIRLGSDPRGWVAERVFYTGSRYYRAYNTRQEFYSRESEHCQMMYSYLSPWHLKGRYRQRFTFKRFSDWANSHVVFFSLPILAVCSLFSLLSFASSVYTYQSTNNQIKDVARHVLESPVSVSVPVPVSSVSDDEHQSCEELEYLSGYHITGFSEYPLFYKGQVHPDVKIQHYLMKSGAMVLSSNDLRAKGYSIEPKGRCNLIVQKGHCDMVISCFSSDEGRRIEL